MGMLELMSSVHS